MNRQETAIGNGSRWLDGLGGRGRAVPRIIARSRDGNFPLPNVRVGSIASFLARSPESAYPLTANGIADIPHPLLGANCGHTIWPIGG
jgi:hypothetical protein